VVARRLLQDEYEDRWCTHCATKYGEYAVLYAARSEERVVTVTKR
jgi:hypothetical protein